MTAVQSAYYCPRGFYLTDWDHLLHMAFTRAIRLTDQGYCRAGTPFFTAGFELLPRVTLYLPDKNRSCVFMGTHSVVCHSHADSCRKFKTTRTLELAKEQGALERVTPRHCKKRPSKCVPRYRSLGRHAHHRLHDDLDRWCVWAGFGSHGRGSIWA